MGIGPAFGSVLYDMVTAKRPFEGKSQIKVASPILEDEPPAITLIGPATPVALEHLISRMLAKDPDQRWQCAADIKAALTLAAMPPSPTNESSAPPLAPQGRLERSD